MEELRPFTTKDGSSSIYHDGINDTYHSRHGAITESKHIFIEAGLRSYCKSHDGSTVNILEVGFGTGLNAILTFIEQLNNIELPMINYTALEPYPIAINVLKELNYLKELQANEAKDVFRKMHSCKSGSKEELNSRFNFIKTQQTLKDYSSSTGFNIIYYDAFGPNAQPEMWTKSCFEKCYTLLNEEGMMVTFCAKGSVKRSLKEVGFAIESLPGPPGKREITRAAKK